MLDVVPFSLSKSKFLFSTISKRAVQLLMQFQNCNSFSCIFFLQKIVLMRRLVHKPCSTISDNNHETYWSGYDKFRNWIFSFKMQFLNNKNLKLMRRKKYGKSLNSIYNFFTFFFPNLFFLSFLLQKIILEWLMDDTKWGKKSY